MNNKNNNSQKEPTTKALDFSKLPPHACSYCGISDRNCVAQCLKCDKWFCNNKPTQHKKSDLYLHLTRSSHTSITTDQGPYAQRQPIKCSTCKVKDVRILYMKIQNTTYTIRCTNCLNKISQDEYQHYFSLLNEKRLPYEIVEKSSKETIKKARNLTYKQISFIEHQWKIGADPRIEQIHGIKTETKPELKKIQGAYSSIDEYIAINLPIIQREEDDDKKEKETWFKHHLSVKWDKIKCQATVTTPEDTYFEIRLSCGDKIKLFCSYFSAEGFVESSKDQEILVAFSPDTEFPKGKTEGYTLQCLWSNTTFERMKEATAELRSKVDLGVVNAILDPPQVENNLNRTNAKALELLRGDFASRKKTTLNTYQLQAIYRALEPEPLTLIQGPPGTGKTETLTAIIYLLLKTIPQNKKILVCAPSNIAVDNLAEALKNLGIKVLRMYSRTRETSGEIRESLAKVSLHEMITEGQDGDAVSLKSLTKLKRSHVWFSKTRQREFQRLREKREAQFLAPARVVCCTCVSTGDSRLAKSIYDYVVIDEAAQALESETLIPLKYKGKKLILAGDHKQLGPLVKSKQVKEANFGQSLFERLAQKIQPTVLLVQYRMHPLIAEFPSQKFYNGLLETAPDRDQIVHPLFPWPNQMPAFFYDIVGREEEPPYKESYFNRLEASFIAELIRRLMNKGVEAHSIGIITPYSAQKDFFNYLFTKILKDQMLQTIEVSSIDGFQGREKDYIIISCVRSNQEIGIGFLNDERRLNVAITRAKFGMVIVGNAQVLAQDPLWKELLQYYQRRELLLSGDLNDLQQSNVRL